MRDTQRRRHSPEDLEAHSMMCDSSAVPAPLGGAVHGSDGRASAEEEDGVASAARCMRSRCLAGKAARAALWALVAVEKKCCLRRGGVSLSGGEVAVAAIHVAPRRGAEEA